MTGYRRKRPAANISCPHEGCKWGRTVFYDSTLDNIDKAKAYFRIYRMWLNHDRRRHRGHISFDAVAERKAEVLLRRGPMVV
jgi:hypothetical protein